MKIKKLNEAFNVDTVQKRIARHNEFDNGHVLHNYEKMTSAEAEEKARLASIENPNDIYYVSYDDIMNPSSDIKWKNGKQVTEQLEADGEDGWGDEIEETLEELFDKMNDIQYEVNNGVRGSYSISGDKVENLVAELQELSAMLNDNISYLEDNSNRLNEASYGGAFDIKDDQYFTREDLDSFAEETLNHINETFKTQFDIASCYIDKGVLELCVTNDEYGDYIYSEKIDMRKIKEPWYLKKIYSFKFASKLINDIVQANDGLIESLNESSNDKEIIFQKGNKKIIKDGYGYGIEDDTNVTTNRFYVNDKGEPKFDDATPGKFWLDKVNSLIKSGKISSRKNETLISKSELKEGIQEDAITASRYLDWEIPEICRGVLDLIEHFPTSKLTYINRLFRDFYAKMESIIHSYTMEDSTYDESLTEDATDIETETLEGPKQGPEFGLAALLNDAIKDEWDAIDTYNSLAVSARDEGFENIAEVIDEINTEENKHVGQLQEILKTISPNTDAIKVGEQEGKEQMSEASDNDTDFELSSEFGISDDDDISEAEMQEALNQIKKLKECTNNSTNIPNNINDVNINDIEEEVVDMREAWEDIYDSFKKIETDLKGDGEAITATIDRLYNDNKSNPDFKKAYDKWASGN